MRPVSEISDSGGGLGTSEEGSVRGSTVAPVKPYGSEPVGSVGIRRKGQTLAIPIESNLQISMADSTWQRRR